MQKQQMNSQKQTEKMDMGKHPLIFQQGAVSPAMDFFYPIAT